MPSLHDLESRFISDLSSLYDPGEIRSIYLWLAEAVLKQSQLHLRLHKDQAISPQQQRQMLEYLKELQAGKPLQYVLGYAYFDGRKFLVNPDVLIPRPETEELVHLALESPKAPFSRILDIGTGSGCIPVTMKLACPDAEVHAWDISPKALEIAESNARMHQADISYKEVDILNPQGPLPSDFDCIISNPPYILRSERPDMHTNVLDFEPDIALFVKNEEALVFYKAIAKFAKNALSPQGFVFLECNRQFAGNIKDLLIEMNFEEVSIYKDMQGSARFVSAQQPA